MQKDRLFERTLFRKLFFSYIALILLCVVFYTLTLIYEDHVIREERVERKTNLMMEEVDRIIRERIIKAQNTVTELNYSAVLKKLYLSKISGMSIDSYNYIDLKDEISKAKITSGLSIAGTMIFLDNDRNAYTSSGMISVGDKAFSMPDLEMPYYGVGTVEDFLGFDNSKRYSFTKEYFIYLDYYTYQNGTNIGIICILFDLDTIEKEIKEVLEPECGVKVTLREQEILEVGHLQGMSYSMESDMMPDMSITLRASKNSLNGENTIFIVILFLVVIVSLMFILLAYRFSQKNYRVIGDIEKLLYTDNSQTAKERSRLTAQEESNYIIQGIEKMIVENTSYQEKMVTIIPYAKAGMLHRVLSGNITGNAIKVLKEEKYLNLIKEYFIVTVVNFCYSEDWEDQDNTARTDKLLDRTCMFFSTEETKVVYYYQDIFNVFLIVNTDLDSLSDDYFYNIHKFLTDNLSDLDCQITMGVDTARDDISELKDAYEGALQALNNIIIDGRGIVYFREDAATDNIDYYFPKTFQDSLLKALKAGEREEIHALLQKIYDKNNILSGNSKMYHSLVDELYISIAKCLKIFFEGSIMHINIEKYTGIATLEEIFDYYEAALFSISESVGIEKVSDRDSEQFEKEILTFIDENYYNPDLSMQTVLEEFHISAKFLGMICRKHYNMTYLQYIQKLRIEKAIALLESGKYSLGQICEMCGYVNQLTFRRNFKAIMKVNPSYYINSDKK